MIIIPAVNCNNFSCVKRRIKKAAEFLPKNSWLQIDVSDGRFSDVKTWNNPEELKKWLAKNKINKFNLEAHLMVDDPQEEIKKWLKAGASRIIVHLETREKNNFKELSKKLSLGKHKFGIALKPETPAKKIAPYLKYVKLVQLLAVPAGYSGKNFNEDVLEKIKYLKKNYPEIKIEVDGGINNRTVKLVKKAGADMAVCGSYLFGRGNFKKRYISLF